MADNPKEITIGELPVKGVIDPYDTLLITSSEGSSARISAKDLAEKIGEQAKEQTIEEATAAAAGYTDEAQALRDQTLQYRNEASQFKNLASANREEKGDWNPGTNTPALTANAATGSNWVPGVSGKPQSYTITVPGNLPFAIKDHAQGTAIGVGYLVQHPSGQWYYDVNESGALAKVNTLEAKAATSTEIPAVLKLLEATVDTNGWCIWASYPDGSFYPPFQAKPLESYQLSSDVLTRIDQGKFIEKAGTNLISYISDIADWVINGVLSDGFVYPPTLTKPGVSAVADAGPLIIGVQNLNAEVLNRIDSNKLADFTTVNILSGTLDTNNLLINGVLSDGFVYPPAPSKGLEIVPFVEPPIDYTAFELLPAERNFPNAIINQWVEPTVVTRTADKSVYMSGIGSGLGAKGELWVGRKKPGGAWERRVAARIRSSDDSDDHNAIAILIDERPGAAYPLILFQSEHGSHQARMCRLTSWEPTEWVFTWVNISASQASYAQAFRYNDEIVFHFRSQTTYTGFTGRSINWLYSSNNGNTWVERRMFAKDTEIWPYLLLKEKADKSGINIAINTHPIESADKGIYFLELNWATGAIINPTDRLNPVSANFRNIFSAAQGVPIQPFAGGVSLMLYTTAGTERKRMWDIGRTNTGNCLIFYTSTPDDGSGMSTFNAAKNRVISFNLDNGVKNFDIAVSDAGMPNERPVGNNLYFSGGCIVNATTVMSFVYKNQSMLSGGLETFPSDGKSVVYLIDISNSSAPVSRQVLQSKYKLMRPEISASGEYIIFCEASRYVTFKDYICNQNFMLTSELI